jgi:hypothetical protein
MRRLTGNPLEVLKYGILVAELALGRTRGVGAGALAVEGVVGGPVPVGAAKVWQAGGVNDG